MPIGRLEQNKRKPSSLETLSSTDSTLESRISSNDIPKMELLKINYVSQSKQGVSATRSSPSAARSSDAIVSASSKPRIDSDPSRVYRYLGNKRPNSHPEMSKKEPERSHYASWDFLQNKRAIPAVVAKACEDCRDCCSECSDCSSTTADSLCCSPAVEKSHSWNYRTKLSAAMKLDLGISNSRAERYRKIDKIDCSHDVVQMRPQRQPVATKSCSDVSKIQQMFERQRDHVPKRESLDFEPSRTTNSRQADSPRRRTFSPAGSDERIKRLDGLQAYDSDCCECKHGRKSLNEPKPVSKIPKKVEAAEQNKRSVSNRQFLKDCKAQAELQEKFDRRDKKMVDFRAQVESKNPPGRQFLKESMARNELQEQLNRRDKKLVDFKAHAESMEPASRQLKKFEESKAQKESNEQFSRHLKRTDVETANRHIQIFAESKEPKEPKELTSWQVKKLTDSKLHKESNEPRNESNEQFNRQIKKMFQSPEKLPEKFVECTVISDTDLPMIIDSKMLRRRNDKAKVERVHIRKKRQPLLIINQLSESAHSSHHADQEKLSNTNTHVHYTETDQSSKAQNTCGYLNCTFSNCPMSPGDPPKKIDPDSDHTNKAQLVKANNIKNLEKSPTADKIISNSPTAEKKKLSAVEEDHRLKDQITIVINRSQQSDPNDVQNFSNKNLTKATTDELLAPSVLNNTIVIKSSSKAKISNVDVNLKNIENRKFNDLKNINHWVDPETDDRHRSHSGDHLGNSVKIFVRNYPVSCSSSADSNSLSDADDRVGRGVGNLIKRYDSQQTASGSSCVTLSSSSVADDEDDDDDEEEDDDDDGTGSALSGDLQKYQSDGSSNCSASVTVSSATGTTVQNVFPPSDFGCDGGIFWNNCYFYDADKSSYCCSAISCDDDNCPYYDLEEGDQVSGCRTEKGQQQVVVQHKKSPRKTDVIHDMRPRSMDGVVDSGVSLNGDTGSSPDSEHMQNQQDLEARRLKRGHVLSELLETERIYVTEMSSILKGSLFEEDIAGGDGGEVLQEPQVNYSPSDFRPKFEAADKNYVFGMNLLNFSSGNVLTGKSTKMFTEVSSGSGSLERMRDDRKTIFKELIELSSCDESLEYQLVKDYLECNSYSEIENDSEFKDYLQRKNYVDILEYLDERCSSASTIRKNSLNNTKKLSNPKELPNADECTHLCEACQARFRKWRPNDLAEKNSKPDAKAKSKTFLTAYKDIYKFCLEFFEESFKDNRKKDVLLMELPAYTEDKYFAIMEKFVTARGFPSIASYVDSKFGSFINMELDTFSGSSGHRRPSRSNNNFILGYCDQMQSEEMMHLVPASLQGKEDILFGNLHELYTFHSEIFLKDLENCISTTELVALCFVQRRDTFYRLYSFYCQNIPRSERLRETLVDTHLFLQECQKRLGHKLPLAAYLLKPVQRITKYQLLLKDLLRFSDSGSCTKELQKALDCMLIVLKCVNDSMHQIAITGFPSDLSQQGELLLQDSFQIWTESKKDIRLRIKPQQRHIFLYQKSMLFCKQTSKTGHNKSTYQFKHYVKMSQIGLTESVRGDPKRFEVWLQGRQEVHTLQAPTIDVKNKWVAEIKRVLLNQLEELKGEKIKQYGLNHRVLHQTGSWDTPNSIISTPQRTMSCDASSESNRNSNCSSDDSCPPHTPGVSSISSTDKENPDGCGWSSDYSNSEDEMSMIEDNSTPGSKFIALADYNAMGHSEVSMREGDAVELLKVGCAGWWFVRILDTNSEGWTPAAYLESINRKSSRSSSRNQERAVNLITIT